MDSLSWLRQYCREVESDLPLVLFILSVNLPVRSVLHTDPVKIAQPGHSRENSLENSPAKENPLTEMCRFDKVRELY
jgi:hypothetical protein